jgi:hypothetical protein
MGTTRSLRRPAATSGRRDARRSIAAQRPNRRERAPRRGRRAKAARRAGSRCERRRLVIPCKVRLGTRSNPAIASAKYSGDPRSRAEGPRSHPHRSGSGQRHGGARLIRAPCACARCWACASFGDSNPARPAPRPIRLIGQPRRSPRPQERLPASARPPHPTMSASQFFAWIFASSSRRSRARSSAARCSCATSSGVTKRTSDLLYRSWRNEACCAASFKIA